jgi:hypothetical protein
MTRSVRVGRSALLTASVCLLAAATAGAGNASAEGGPLVALTALQGDKTHVYLMNPDGTGRRRLRSAIPARLDVSEGPSWSADGRDVAFAAVRNPLAESDPQSEIHMIGVDGSGERRLTRGSISDYSPSLSPDGTRIAFARITKAGQRAFVVSIFVMRVDGSAQTRLTDGAIDQAPVWAPDGRRLAFTRLRIGRRGPTPPSVDVMNVDGTGQRALASDGSYPSWSPDGSRIAFSSSRDKNDEIYVMNADGTGKTRLTRNRAEDEAPTWSPDGGQIAFASDRAYRTDADNFELYLMDPGGGCVTRMTNTSSSSLLLQWQRSVGRAPVAECGGTLPVAQQPIVETDLAQAESFNRFPLFYLGPTYREMLLTDASPEQDLGYFSFSYDDCGLLTPSSCGDQVALNINSVCELDPVISAPLFDIGTDATLPPLGRVRYSTARGALVALGGIDTLDVYTGSVVISISASRRSARAIMSVLQPLRGPADRRLSPPALPRGILRQLRRTRRAFLRYGSSVSAARHLHVTRRKVLARLALARVLRRFGPLRATSC